MKLPALPDRTVTIIGVAAAILGICLVVVAAIWKGDIQSLSGSQLLGLFGFLSTLVSVLATLVKTASVETKVNGHLAKHDQQVKDLIARIPPAQSPAPPAEPPAQEGKR